jgi:lysyl-tRNA synthetase class 2
MASQGSARANIKLRSRALQSVRRFFTERDYLEVETPVRVDTPALELHIDAIPSAEAYLRTSPEHHLKRLLVEGFERIFELGPCFRSDEVGKKHQPEFSMLEWYRVGADYGAMLDETQSLLVAVACDILGTPQLLIDGQLIDLEQEWLSLSIADVFKLRCDWNPLVDFDADRFDLDLVEKVEPSLPVDCPVILEDYPVQLAAQARCKPGDVPVAERWELYIGGLELANAYSEETDAEILRKRFETCRDARQRMGKTPYAIDDAYLQALQEGVPACAGVALGMDRLVMLLADASDIAEVRTFPAAVPGA